MQDQIKSLYESYSKSLGFQPGMYDNVKSVRVDSTYLMHKMLAKVHNAINTGDDAVAIQELRAVARAFVANYTDIQPEELVKNFESLKIAVELHKSVDALSDLWTREFYEPFLQSFMSHGLFDAEELTPELVDPGFFVNLREAAKHMKSYRYSSSDAEIDGIASAPMRMAEDIIIIDDVSHFFSYLKRKDMRDGVAYAHVLLKVEERVDLSHFIVALSYNGHSFLSTDMPSFSTPHNKKSTRNPRRHMEAKYDSLAFPYGIIDELDEIRKREKTPAKFGDQTIDIYKEPMRGMPAYCKLFMIGVADALKRKAPSIEAEAMLLGDFVETKLIGDIGLTESDDDLFVGHKDKHRKLLSDVLDTLGESTALVKVDSQLVVSSHHYDRNWLATPEHLEKLTKWMALDAKKSDMQSKLNEAFTEAEGGKAIDWLNRKVNEPGNMQRILPFIYAGQDRSYFEVVDLVDVDGESFDSVGMDDSRVVQMVSTNKSFFTQVHIGLHPDGVRERSEDWTRSKGSYQDYIWRGECACCGKRRTTIKKYVKILHWQVISLLTGLDRKDITGYLRAYRCSQLIPYHGNSITDAVHPLSLLVHPSWNRYPNGINGTVHICGVCHNKYAKMYGKYDRAVVSIDGSVSELPEQRATLQYSADY